MYFGLVALSVVVLLSFEMLCHRRDNGLNQGETNFVFGAERQASPVSEFLAAPDQVVKNQELPKVNVSQSVVEGSESGQESLQTEPVDLTGEYFNKADWRNSGFQTISSIIETYYWSMREGNLNRWMECMTPRELTAWQLLVKGRIDVVVTKLVASLNEVRSYQIELAVKIHDQEYIITAKHTMTKGTPVVERFAVLRTGMEWKIAGEDGFLNYGHHPGDVSRFDVLPKRPDQQRESFD